MKPFLCWLGLHRYRRAHREMNGRSFMGGICERCGHAYWLVIPEAPPAPDPPCGLSKGEAKPRPPWSPLAIRGQPKPRGDHVEPSKPWPRA